MPQDGYAALHAIVYDCTDILDEFWNGFGPQWKPNQQPSSYAAKFETKLKIERMRNDIEYSNTEICLEMLNRALEAGYKPTTATSIKQTIMSWKDINPTQALPNIYNISPIVNQLEKSYKKCWIPEITIIVTKWKLKIYSEHPENTEQ